MNWGLLQAGLLEAMSLQNLFACFLGAFAGIMTGTLPGIGPIATMSLLLPVTFGMSPTTGLIMYAGIYYGAMYAGKTTSILMNVPGEGAAVITCLDGFPMGQKGRAGPAMTVSSLASFFGGLVGTVGLMAFAPPLARAALRFGPPEYFGLAVFGLVILCNLVGASMLRSISMVLIGIVISTIGIDPITSYARFTFHLPELQRGLEFATVAMGTFGLGEVMATITGSMETLQPKKINLRDLYPSKEEMTRSVAPTIRGTIIGFLVGLLPGPSSVVSTFVSYSVEKRVSKTPEKFGTGMVEGVAGPEAANNSATSGAMIPLLALGIPFSPATALLLTGLLIHGVTPGPTFITQHSMIFWTLVGSMFIGNVILLILDLPLIGVFASLLRIPLPILMPIISVIIMQGAYAMNNSVFDIFLVVLTGLLGYVMRKTNFETAPLVVGLVLGGVLESGLRQGLMISKGSFVIMVSRPITFVFLLVSLLVIVIQTWNGIKRKRTGKERMIFND
jgi:putative tricarboxylic transport membrane protein